MGSLKKIFLFAEKNIILSESANIPKRIAKFGRRAMIEV